LFHSKKCPSSATVVAWKLIRRALQINEVMEELDKTATDPAHEVRRGSFFFSYLSSLTFFFILSSSPAFHPLPSSSFF